MLALICFNSCTSALRVANFLSRGSLRSIARFLESSPTDVSFKQASKFNNSEKEAKIQQSCPIKVVPIHKKMCPDNFVPDSEKLSQKRVSPYTLIGFLFFLQFLWDRLISVFNNSDQNLSPTSISKFQEALRIENLCRRYASYLVKGSATFLICKKNATRSIKCQEATSATNCNNRNGSCNGLFCSMSWALFRSECESWSRFFHEI